MKKKIITIILLGMMVSSFTACGNSKDATTQQEGTTQADSGQAEVTTNESSGEITYQNILDEYTKKIEDAIPGLVEEFNSEAEEKKGDVEALAEISASKIEKLAEINAEGIEKMAKLKKKNDDSDDIYSEWAGKLADFYTEQVQQITDAYMNSVTE